LYAYLHDQTLRRMNQGETGTEIAETIEMPPALERAWHTRGYYGSVSHNVKAIYQRYMGWYDGNPAHLWQYPPVETARRYVEIMGGVDQVVEKARDFAARGDLRFAAELASHAVFAAPDHTPARETLAAVLERLGFGAECATCNCYLAGAYELRKGIERNPISPGGMVAALTITQLFDAIALRIDGPKAWDQHLSLAWRFTDVGERYWMELSNGALIHYPTDQDRHDADLSLSLTRRNLPKVLITGSLDGVTYEGDASVVRRLLALTDQPDPEFAVVTP
jgi:alkyl sulfatase BDS1-like metallo-beta-lactamase superfamily hydrolase